MAWHSHRRAVTAKPTRPAPVAIQHHANVQPISRLRRSVKPEENYAHDGIVV
jgi:hypothetical protein